MLLFHSYLFLIGIWVRNWIISWCILMYCCVFVLWSHWNTNNMNWPSTTTSFTTLVSFWTCCSLRIKSYKSPDQVAISLRLTSSFPSTKYNSIETILPPECFSEMEPLVLVCGISHFKFLLLWTFREEVKCIHGAVSQRFRCSFFTVQSIPV